MACVRGWVCVGVGVGVSVGAWGGGGRTEVSVQRRPAKCRAQDAAFHRTVTHMISQLQSVGAARRRGRCGGRVSRPSVGWGVIYGLPIEESTVWPLLPSFPRGDCDRGSTGRAWGRTRSFGFASGARGLSMNVHTSLPILSGAAPCQDCATSAESRQRKRTRRGPRHRRFGAERGSSFFVQAPLEPPRIDAASVRDPEEDLPAGFVIPTHR